MIGIYRKLFSLNILCLKFIPHIFVWFKLDTNRWNQFKCTNEKYIPVNYTCNGIDDCGDNSDETKGCTGTFENYTM